MMACQHEPANSWVFSMFLNSRGLGFPMTKLPASWLSWPVPRHHKARHSQSPPEPDLAGWSLWQRPGDVFGWRKKKGKNPGKPSTLRPMEMMLAAFLQQQLRWIFYWLMLFFIFHSCNNLFQDLLGLFLLTSSAGPHIPGSLHQHPPNSACSICCLWGNNTSCFPTSWEAAEFDLANKKRFKTAISRHSPILQDLPELQKWKPL